MLTPFFENKTANKKIQHIRRKREGKWQNEQTKKKRRPYCSTQQGVSKKKIHTWTGYEDEQTNVEEPSNTQHTVSIEQKKTAHGHTGNRCCRRHDLCRTRYTVPLTHAHTHLPLWLFAQHTRIYIFAHPSRAKEPCSRGVRRAAKRRWTKKSPATNVLKRNKRTHRHTRQHYGILKLDACVCVCACSRIFQTRVRLFQGTQKCRGKRGHVS